MARQFDHAHARRLMVEQQLARRGVCNEAVLEAMGEVPRELFVGEAMQQHAYSDGPLPIEAGQTISQPLVVAVMIEAADVAAGDKVLEIGAGSGYAAAVAGRIAARVFAVERHADLAASATARVRKLGYDNVDIRIGDGSGGLPEEAPFDAIIVSASAPAIPQALKEQMRVGGRLVIPVGRTHDQRLIRIVREGETVYKQEDLGGVAFVPLVGAHAWSEQ
jgi:protein-L-isoaspartate(D-aspartate) O-methyltransferase